ncbi:MAG: non-canonical purine NTP pyrophosphatase, RdgB/HAM1 family [Alphaproteobacteria bacterium]|nr:MAG: non-canonical purine NTP pyrophosphatase, RdgB/HAM1 family [Alphaproteobacteria bacterium]
MNLLFASANEHKLGEYRELLSPSGIRVHSAQRFKPQATIESGETFTENAIIKATTLGEHSKKPTFADDSGLVIPLFPHVAGVHSSRYAISNGGFPKVFSVMHAELGSDVVPAFFECVIAYHDSSSNVTRTFCGRVDGHVTFPARGKDGFGYDAIFIPLGYAETFAELGATIKRLISHRARACSIFSDYMKALGA